ncbi:MAG: radical SAM family heme chaperone HemW [Anaerolineaceae bacterium]|nr:radical SAM family heme chaperone HemW [Anaerolineaceae bacterium]
MIFPSSLYLHIPFCRIKCTYCAFNTYVNLDNLIEPFVRALIKEIQIVGRSKPQQKLHTVYIGGGTPSLLTASQLDRILTTIRHEFDLLADSEISMESNPSDLTSEYMAAVKAVGINRLSIGMQSANDTELKLFERRHDLDAVLRAVESAREGGFDNLNLDLIYGIPQQTLADWEKSLQVLLSLTPEHVSLYALGLEDGTPLKTWVDTGKYPAPDDDLAADMYDLATDMLGSAGLAQYEISNWAKPGLECRHNLQYWRNLPYPGVGPGAHGYADGVRYSTILSPQRYIKLMNEAHREFVFPHTPATEQATVVDRESEIAETLIMGLRLTQEGIRRDSFRERFGEDLLDVHPETIARYEKNGLLYVDNNVVRITERGRLLSNMVFRDLV